MPSEYFQLADGKGAQCGVSGVCVRCEGACVSVSSVGMIEEQ